MLFPKHKLVFVHVPKSAGASIESLFGFPEDVAATRDRHDSLAQIQRKYPECIEWTSFLVARNIWHKIVSIYNHVKTAAGPEWPRDRIGTFEDFVRFLCSTEQHYREASICRMAEGLEEKNVDVVLRYEYLREDLASFLELQNITDIHVENLPHWRHNMPQYDRDYKKYYDEETRRLVEERFEDDIQKFGYRFQDL
jgi:hypothetical protein